VDSNAHDPIDLLFGGMAKLGPGDDDETARVLRLLPPRRIRTVVEAGCGTGRATLVLARELGQVVHAVDDRRSFLAELRRRAGEAGLEALVQTREMDMTDIPRAFRDVDLLWSEGAAYSIGFARALETWAAALASNGLLVASELSWLTEDRPQDVNDYFRVAYPDMRPVPENLRAAVSAGYRVLFTRALPPSAWRTGYYDMLRPRARALLAHEDPSVRALAQETLDEIAVFERSRGSYGYVFYALERA
jgi:SAM-dependent methyltransferase